MTRLDQLMEAEPDTIAVGCPFCTTMMGDAAKAKGIDEQVRVKDVVELVAESLATSEPAPTAEPEADTETTEASE